MVDRKLGRGLDFFLSGGRGKTAKETPEPAADRGKVAAKPPAKAQPAKQAAQDAPAAPEQAPVATDGQTMMVEVGLLGPNPNQPRKVMEDGALKELADSIRASGVLQPILARKAGKRFEIVAGERRWRAAQQAGLKQVPVLVKEVTDEESAVFALVENLQREDLNAIEKAKAFHELKGRLSASQDEIAKRVGLDRSTVANFVRLLDLPAEVQEHVSRGTLSMGHARSLLGPPDKAMRVKLADEVVKQGLSVRALEALVREHAVGRPQGDTKPGAKPKTRTKAAWLNEIEETLAETFSTTVGVRYSKKKSVIQIECVGREEFERIYSRLKDC